MKNDLKTKYFNWLCDLVYTDSAHRISSYNKLLSYLDCIEFEYDEQLDVNRAKAGVNFRYRFGFEHGISNIDIEEQLDVRPCSVLEMMVTLAFTCEESIMTNLDYGDRTGQWFWNMIATLGLGSMTDESFDEDYVCECILRFMNREYDYYGNGGLFVVNNPYKDMRETDIWYQLCWYLNENYEDE